MADPTLSEVHADLVGRLEQDKRLRAVEQGLATQSATMTAALTDLAADRIEQRRDRELMEARLMAAIEAAKPKVWPAVGGVAAVCMVAFALFAIIYTH